MTYLLKFGSYQFPVGFAPTQDDDKRNVSTAPIPRRDGEAWLPAVREKRKIQIKGGFIRGQLGCTNVRGSIDSLKAALSGPGNLQLDDDRALHNVQAENIMASYDAAYGRYGFVTIDMIAPDPYFYALAAATDTWTASPVTGSHTVTVSAGNACVLPAITLTCGSLDYLAVTISNTTTGEACTLTGALAELTLTLDTAAGTVKYGSGADAMGLFDGLFLHLAPGANTLTVAYGSVPGGSTAAHISNLVSSWLSRWY